MNKETLALVESARNRVAEFDRCDALHNVATPNEASIAAHLRCAMDALGAAMSLKDWAIAAESYVLLEQLLKRAN